MRAAKQRSIKDRLLQALARNNEGNVKPWIAAAGFLLAGVLLLHEAFGSDGVVLRKLLFGLLVVATGVGLVWGLRRFSRYLGNPSLHEVSVTCVHEDHGMDMYIVQCDCGWTEDGRTASDAFAKGRKHSSNVVKDIEVIDA